MKHAIECLPIALKQLGEERDLVTQACGIFIDKEHKCLAASPSATAGTEMIVHIECPVSIFNKDPNNAAVLGKNSIIWASNVSGLFRARERWEMDLLVRKK